VVIYYFLFYLHALRETYIVNFIVHLGCVVCTRHCIWGALLQVVVGRYVCNIRYNDDNIAKTTCYGLISICSCPIRIWHVGKIQGWLTLFKIDLPNLVISLNWTALFKWYVIGCGSKNDFKNYMCLKKKGLHAQNMLTMVLYHNIKNATKFDNVLIFDFKIKPNIHDIGSHHHHWLKCMFQGQF
jgi:hypothetical protein